MPDIFISDSNKKKKTSKKPVKAPSVKKPRKLIKHSHNEEGHTHNPLAAYHFHPDRAEFETREKNEEVVLLLRRHPITNVRWILIFLIMVFAPLVLSTFPFLDFLPGNFQFIAILGWYLVTIALALENFLTWFYNVNIITDERVVDIDFHNLIYKEVSDTNIDRIQDVTYRMGGAIRTVFNFGDVLIQTAGEKPNFEFLNVPNPHKVAKILQDLRIEEEQEKLEGRVR